MLETHVDSGSVEIYPSWTGTVVGLVCLLSSVLLGWSTPDGDSGDAVLTAIALFGAAVTLWQFSKVRWNTPLVTIDERGFRDKRMGIGQVMWEQVKSADTCGVSEICLKLRAPVGGRAKLETHAWGLRISHREYRDHFKRYLGSRFSYGNYKGGVAVNGFGEEKPNESLRK